MDSHADILSLPNLDSVYVSPLYKSDISGLEGIKMIETDPTVYGSPAANLQGEKRGLVAFKIISSRNNPDGGKEILWVNWAQ